MRHTLIVAEGWGVTKMAAWQWCVHHELDCWTVDSHQIHVGLHVSHQVPGQNRLRWFHVLFCRLLQISLSEIWIWHRYGIGPHRLLLGLMFYFQLCPTPIFSQVQRYNNCCHPSFTKDARWRCTASRRRLYNGAHTLPRPKLLNLAVIRGCNKLLCRRGDRPTKKAFVGGEGESMRSVIHEDRLRGREMGKEDTGGRVIFTMLGCGLWMGIEWDDGGASAGGSVYSIVIVHCEWTKESNRVSVVACQTALSSPVYYDN